MDSAAEGYPVSEHAEPILQLPPQRRPGGPGQDLKSLAKNLARDSVADISDRHLRARMRTRYYNHLLALLRQFDSQCAADRHRYRRLQRAAAGIIAVLTAALVGSLLV